MESVWRLGLVRTSTGIIMASLNELKRLIGKSHKGEEGVHGLGRFRPRY